MTDDNEIEELEEGEEGEEEEEEQAPPDPPPRRRGRKPGSKNRPKVGVGVIPPPPAEFAAIEAPADGPDPLNQRTWGDDPLVVWPLMIEYCTTKGYANVADVVSISVSRQPSAPYTGPMQALPSIPVSAVVGDGYTDPGEALLRYITQVYHLGYDRPARYELRFLFRPSKSHIFKIAHVTLADPREIGASQGRATQFQASQAYQGGGWPQAPAPIGVGRQQQTPMPQAAPYQPLPISAYGYDPSVAQAVEGMRREMAMVFGMMNQQQQAEAARQLGMGAPPPVAQQVISQPQAQAEMIATTVAATLKALGFGAPPPAAPPAAAPAPQPTPFNPFVVVPQSQGPIGLSGFVSDAREKLGNLRDLAKVMKDFEGVREQLGFGGRQEEEEEPAAATAANPVDSNAPPFVVRKIPFTGSPISGGQDINYVERSRKDSSGDMIPKPFQEWALEMAAANPQLATNVVEQVTRIIDQSTIGSLIKRAAESNAARAPAALGVGATPPNGVATGNGGYTPP